MEEKEKVILVGCQLPQDDDEKFMHSMKEPCIASEDCTSRIVSVYNAKTTEVSSGDLYRER